MDTSTSSVFREKSLERLSSPKQFNNSLNVTKVSVWVALVAILILLAGLLTWAILGFVEITIKTHGIAESGVVTCYVPGDTAVAVGMEARIDDIHNPQNMDPVKTGEVTGIKLVVANMDELVSSATYSVESHNPSAHSLAVTISAPDTTDGLVSVTILRERVHPISFLTGQSV